MMNTMTTVSSIISTINDFLKEYIAWEKFVDLKNILTENSLIKRIPRWTFIIIPSTFVIYKYTTRNYGVFKRLGIKGPRPYPLVGTLLPLFTKGLIKHDMDLRKYGSIVGTFQGQTPTMLVYDVELIKQIMVKDFSHFINRGQRPTWEYLINKMLVRLEGDQWKRVRTILTPTFSGRKLRMMNTKFQECSQTFLNNLLVKADSGETVELKSLCGTFTMDAIARTAFGIQIDSHNDPKNRFVVMANKAFNIPVFGLMFRFFFPYLMWPLYRLGFSFFTMSHESIEFFRDVINSAAESRGYDEKDVDFLQIMLNAHKEINLQTETKNDQTMADDHNEVKGLTKDELLAQGLLFFLAGYESTANTLSMLFYCLATNAECQEKLIEEIDRVMSGKSEVTYDVIKEMQYLDMCLNETLRLYPTAMRTDRGALEDVTINGVFIPKNMIVAIPIYCLHMDPEAWPEPSKFIPERFTPEAKAARNPYYYLPFGAGPRNCIGMRLALTELKVAIVTLLQKIKFVTAPETQVPLQLQKMAMRGKKGIQLRIEKRRITT